MTIIREDKFGLYCVCGNTVVRPTVQSRYIAGQFVESRLFKRLGYAGLGRVFGNPTRFHEHWYIDTKVDPKQKDDLDKVLVEYELSKNRTCSRCQQKYGLHKFPGMNCPLVTMNGRFVPREFMPSVFKLSYRIKKEEE